MHIPLIVLEEVDHFKRDQNENGRNARQFSRLVDELRSKGSLSTGVDLENGGKLFISVDIPPNQDRDKIKLGLDLSINDNLILLKATSLKEKNTLVTLISKDINLRVKADALGLKSEDYGQRNITVDELYSGVITMEVSPEELNTFQAERLLPFSDKWSVALCPNQYVILQNKLIPGKKLYGRFNAKKKGIIPLINKREGIWGVYPKNVEQQFAFDALLNDEIKLVTLIGKAGTGKTLMAIAAGLEMCLSENKYDRVLVSRPVMPMGKDIGFLPGDVNDKLGPWMQPIFDNMDFLFRSKGDHTKGGAGSQKNGATEKSSWENLINQGLLHIEPLTYIRGRSIPSQYLIVDEAQNLTPHEVKTIVTRVGEGTKIILTGDCEQIDNPYLDSINNGLAYCVERLKMEEIIGHTTLVIGERSQLAEIATKLL